MKSKTKISLGPGIASYLCAATIMIRAFKLNTTRIQVIGWIIFYVINFVHLILQADANRAFANTTVSTVFSLAIIYGNIALLIPYFFPNKRYLFYGLALLSMMLLVTTIRVWVQHHVYGIYFNDDRYDYSLKQWAIVSFSSLSTLIVSYLLYGALRYFMLLREAAEREARHARAELNLLKSQVQPHFIFNTMNNIYYEARQGSPNTAQLIGRVSSLMRYFVDDSPREKVDLSTEIEFLRNYIELERIRLRYEVELLFKVSDVNNVLVPPMLLMPLVENLFKHGIDRTTKDQRIEMSLEITGRLLEFRVTNPVTASNTGQRNGFGLSNLRKRLKLLYADNFTLLSERIGDRFESKLIIPV